MEILVPWLAYDGTELANGVRTRDYIRNGLAGPLFADTASADCPAIDDGPYVNPFTDDAPWFEATVAASEEFLGLYPTSITIDPPFTREVRARIPDGSHLGRLEQRGRIVNVEGILVATSERGMSWGQRWLSEVLRCGCEDCDLGDLCVLPSCPDAGFGYELETNEFRTLRDAGLVQGPDFFPVGRDRCHQLGVQFQMASKHPYLFGDKELEFSGAFSEGDAGVDAHDVCGSVTTPEWIGDTALIIEVHTYSKSLTNVEINVWPSNDVSGCPPSGTLPTPLAAYTIASLAPGQILTIDGATRKVTRYDKAAKRVVEGLSAVAPLGTDIVLWPTVGGACRTACVCADVDQTADTGGADVFVYSQLRET